MALVLAMQEGRSIFVGDREVQVNRIESPTRVRVTVKGPLDTEMTLTPTARVEVADGVFMMVGLGSTATLAKIAIEAPRSIKILRDSLYREELERPVDV